MLRWGGMIVSVLVAGANVACAADARPACLRAVRAVPAGSIPTEADFVGAECGAAAPPSVFHYDRRAGVVRSVRDIRADEVVPGIPDFELAVIRPGQRIFVTTRVGPVKVQRQAEAVQAAKVGERLFVRTADGKVFSVPFPEDLQ